MKLSQIKEAKRFFPLAQRRQAIRQAVKLVRAKQYLANEGISVIAPGSKFQYARSTGSVL
jgi:hypothetical protein